MRTVVGLFQDKNEARRTIDDLKRIGVEEANVSVLSNEETTGPMSAYLDEKSISRTPQGILTALVRMGLTETEAQRYVDGVREGGTLETVAVDDAKANEALEIMRAHALGTGARAQRAAERDKRAADIRAERPGARAGERAEQILPVIVEELNVGKREVATGGIRAKSTVETIPVEEEVELRTENIDVERRTVDRPVAAGDTDAFRDREIEVTATSEEPVIEKTARVVEEVVLTKGVDTRTETIHETVRRTDVNVERLPYEPSKYRAHYNAEYGKTGAKFDDYEPAYRYGHQLRAGADEDIETSDWSAVEPNAKTHWEKGHPNTWDRFKGAIRHAWERAKG
jgi:uncharacterized protein (TIGR02271 family)